MKLPRILVVVIGIALLVTAIGCSTTPPVEVAPTPNIDATVEARVKQNNGGNLTEVNHGEKRGLGCHKYHMNG